MYEPEDLRDSILGTLEHIRKVDQKVKMNSGPNLALAAPDRHKISEGLFLSIFTHWEEFTRALLVADLSADRQGKLFKHVRRFRTKRAPWHLAERFLLHVDHPKAYFRWNYEDVRKRADEYLGSGHRFARPLPVDSDLAKLKTVRNAIAHRGDSAWDKFMTVVRKPPFSLAKSSCRGITPGRFLATAQWKNVTVLEHALDLIEKSVRVLVP